VIDAYSAAVRAVLCATAARDGLAGAHYRGRRLAAEVAEPEAAALMASSMTAASTKQSVGERHRSEPSHRDAMRQSLTFAGCSHLFIMLRKKRRCK
jgi:hypothetical protein